MTRMKVHATEVRTGSLQRFHTRRGPELRYVKSQAHRLSDELVPPRRPIEPVETSWLELLASFAVIGGIYLAFIVWMAVASVSTVAP